MSGRIRNTMARAAELLAERSAVDADSGCLLWNGYKQTGGYGQIEIDGRLWLTHRLSWHLARGPIPAGMLVLHHCDVPACINPEHLFLGDHRANTLDSIEKGRHRGRLPDWAVKKRRIRKLTDEQVREIRVATGTLKDIARRFGLRSHSTVCNIRNGKRKTLVQ